MMEKVAKVLPQKQKDEIETEKLKVVRIWLDLSTFICFVMSV
jgi:hypothetical protein